MSATPSCREFTRSQLLARGAAAAGSGLPEVEPGAPAPAGTGLSRRSLLLRGAGLALSVYGASRLAGSALEAGAARAASLPPGRVLVSVFLPGGVDTLSAIAPVADGRYRKLRPVLALGEGVGVPFDGLDGVAWHPKLAPLADLHRQGKLLAAPAAGWDHPDQSHFTSRHYWEAGAADARLQTGWMGRILDAAGSADNPLQGLSLDGALSPALASSRVPVAAVEDPLSFGLWLPGVWGDPEELLYRAFGEMGAPASASAAELQAARTAQLTIKVREQLRAVSPKDNPDTDDDESQVALPAGYPDNDDSGFAARLAALAHMLRAGLPLSCVAIQAPGDYDTHDGQPEPLEKGLDVVARSLAAFQADLDRSGLAGRVVTHIWSEFGRRPEENGSKGTDHGAAGLCMVMGGPVAGGLLGGMSPLDRLDSLGNLRPTVDFRAIQCSLVEQWMGLDAQQVIPGARKFARPKLIR